MTAVVISDVLPRVQTIVGRITKTVRLAAIAVRQVRLAVLAPVRVASAVAAASAAVVVAAVVVAVVTLLVDDHLADAVNS